MNTHDTSPSISVEEKYYQWKTEVDIVSTVADCTPLIKAPARQQNLLLIRIVRITSNGDHKKETPGPN